MGIEYDDNVNDLAFETKARDKAGSSLANSTSDTIFQKAVVVDVINDPAAFRNQQDFEKKYDKNTIENNSYIARAPRNSVIARVLNDGQGKRKKSFIICLPFFPPHLCFPIKPGEHVWLISPAPIGKKAKVFYWMCRVPTWLDVDDVNYTHEDRFNHYKGIEVNKADAADKANNAKPKSESADDPDMYGFPNGTGETDGFTFGDSEEEYDIHVTGSLAYKSFKFEPVPRLTKMPGDMVIQGSNNASITLGTARGFKGGWAAEKAEDVRIKDEQDAVLTGGEEGNIIRSNATRVDPSKLLKPDGKPDSVPDLENFSAAIDIVTGRSLRTRKNPAIAPIVAADSNPPGVDMAGGHAPTFPRLKSTIHPSGSRAEELVEVSKNPQGYLEDVKENQKDNPIEGDPDFRYDASRIYITADSKPDLDFGLVDQLAHLPGAHEAAVTEGASVVVKSDHVRIIARKDPDDATGQVNGSIRIIKEGAPKEPGDDKNTPPADERAIIAIEPDGTIIIDGPRVVLGNGHNSAATPNGLGITGAYTENDHVYIGGADAAHSVFLAEELADTLVAFAVDVANWVGSIDGVSHPGFGSGGKSPGGGKASTGNSGAPIQNATSTAVINKLKDNLRKSVSKVIKIK